MEELSKGDKGKLMEGLRKGDNSIVGKLHYDCTISKDVIRSTMSKV